MKKTRESVTFHIWPAANMNEEWPMPLLCISLLALLLLPLSLSGGSKRPPSHHWYFIQTHLDNANDSTTTLLQNQNKSCTRPKSKVPNCTPDGNFVRTLCNLTHKMENLNLTGKVPLLVKHVLVSLDCPDNPDKKTKRTKSVRRRLCSAKAFLLAMTNCYQMLNTISAESTDGPPTPNWSSLWSKKKTCTSSTYARGSFHFI